MHILKKYVFSQRLSSSTFFSGDFFQILTKIYFKSNFYYLTQIKGVNLVYTLNQNYLSQVYLTQGIPVLVTVIMIIITIIIIMIIIAIITINIIISRLYLLLGALTMIFSTEI